MVCALVLNGFVLFAEIQIVWLKVDNLIGLPLYLGNLCPNLTF